MARKTGRNFLVDFATLEIEYLPQKGPKVSDDIQMVYVMGNVAPAAPAGGGFFPGYNTPDPAVRSFGVLVTVTAVAAQRSRIELLAPAGGGGIWIYSIHNTDNTSAGCNIFTLGALSGLASTLNPTAANSSSFGDGGAAGVIIEFGNDAVLAPTRALRLDIANAGTDNPYVFTGSGAKSGGIFVGPGRVFVVQHGTVNTQIGFNVQWTEVA